MKRERGDQGADFCGTCDVKTCTNVQKHRSQEGVRQVHQDNPDAPSLFLCASAAVLLLPAVGVHSRQRLALLAAPIPGTTDSSCYRQCPDLWKPGSSICHSFAPFDAMRCGPGEYLLSLPTGFSSSERVMHQSRYSRSDTRDYTPKWFHNQFLLCNRSARNNNDRLYADVIPRTDHSRPHMGEW